MCVPTKLNIISETLKRTKLISAGDTNFSTPFATFGVLKFPHQSKGFK